MGTFDNDNQIGLPQLSENYWTDFKSKNKEGKENPIVENVLTTNFSGNLDLEKISLFNNQKNNFLLFICTILNTKNSRRYDESF